MEAGGRPAPLRQVAVIAVGPRVIPPIEQNEADLLGQVLQLAKVFGWARAHFRPAKTEHGWRTAVQGDGAGFPDLILVRPPRLVVAELKAARGRLEADQQQWLDWFRSVPGVDVHVWRPADWDLIVATLR